MSTYVISDIHGQFYAYKKMLEKIRFSDEDFLYVLGDCIDRGPDGIRIIRDLMNRKNAELILGNHEFMLLNALQYFREHENGQELSQKTDDGLNAFELWTHPCNGGEGTCLEFLNLPKSEQEEIEKYLRKLRLIKRVKLGDNTYHLSHSFSTKRQFRKDVLYSKADYKTAESIVWESLFDKTHDKAIKEKLFYYQKDIYVVGHIFTQRLNNMDENGKGCIYRNDSYCGYKVIDVDCGMALNSRSSRLGCIRLEDNAEFYVPLLDD